jgi:hypothetical protein
MSRRFEKAILAATVSPAPIVVKPRKKRQAPATLPPTARSLKPGQPLMEACAAGNVEAQAIRDMWAFRFPVTQSPVHLDSDPQVIIGSDQRGGGR